MDEPQRPAELSEEAWQASPPEVRQFIALLVAKLAALEARLHQTSQNSSKPPSSDPPSAPPATGNTPRGKPKPKGAQPGHSDPQRELLPVAEVTRVVPLRPTCCPTCQHDLPDDLPTVGPPRRHQVWEIPPVDPEITEYQYHSVCCPGCQTWVNAPRPDDVPPGAFGPRVVALIALLHGRYRISNRELVALLQMVWLLPISVGSVAQLPQVDSAALAPAQEEVQAAVSEADHVHVDETSWHEGTRKPWLWVAVGAVATLFLLPYGRGKTQLHALLGASFVGRVTSDRLSAYNSLDPKRRQLCWAHLVRNLRGRAEARGPWQADATALLALAEEVLVIWGLLPGRPPGSPHHAGDDPGHPTGDVGTGRTGEAPEKHPGESLRRSRAARGCAVDVSRRGGHRADQQCGRTGVAARRTLAQGLFRDPERCR